MVMARTRTRTRIRVATTTRTRTTTAVMRTTTMAMEATETRAAMRTATTRIPAMEMDEEDAEDAEVMVAATTTGDQTPSFSLGSSYETWNPRHTTTTSNIQTIPKRRTSDDTKRSGRLVSFCFSIG